MRQRNGGHAATCDAPRSGGNERPCRPTPPFALARYSLPITLQGDALLPTSERSFPGVLNAGDGRHDGEHMKTTAGYMRGAMIATVAGLVACFWIGAAIEGDLRDGLSYLVIGTALATLEISLSFDNAIVNANTLASMAPAWRRRFLTWGILIAVFGMRLILPLAIVAIAAAIGPLEALKLALFHPRQYGHVIEGAHLQIAAFGGTFLMMVALHYFIDERKEVNWFSRLECRLRACASMQGLEIAFVLIIILGFASMLPTEKVDGYMIAAIAGLVTYSVVRALGRALDGEHGANRVAGMGGLGAFLYLEVLDASFSFDGVVGAFAMTSDLFLMAIGLGIGAMYVRSMTIMLVERQMLSQFRYLEHGAFYSILILSLILFLETQVEISEIATGAVGVLLVGSALWSSIRHNRETEERA